MFHGGYRYGSRTIRKLEVGEERKNEKNNQVKLPIWLNLGDLQVPEQGCPTRGTRAACGPALQ